MTAFTAGQLVTERDWPGWPGRRRFHADYLRLSAGGRHRRMEYRSARSGRPSAPRGAVWYLPRLVSSGSLAMHAVGGGLRAVAARHDDGVADEDGACCQLGPARTWGILAASRMTAIRPEAMSRTLLTDR